MFAAIVGAVGFEENNKAPTPKRKIRWPVLDLRRLASVTVPAHGLVVSRGAISPGGLGNQFLFWMKKLISAVSVAGMIALGLFIYTEFTQAWVKRGLPAIPISALAALDQGHARGPTGGNQGGVQQSQERKNSPPQTLSLLDDYNG